MTPPPTAADLPTAQTPVPSRPDLVERDLDALLEDDEVIDGAVAAAHRRVVRYYGRLGTPIAVWRNGRVVEEVPSPDELDSPASDQH